MRLGVTGICLGGKRSCVRLTQNSTLGFLPCNPLLMGSLVCTLTPKIRALLLYLALSTESPDPTSRLLPEREARVASDSLFNFQTLHGPKHPVVTLPAGGGSVGLVLFNQKS